MTNTASTLQTHTNRQQRPSAAPSPASHTMAKGMRDGFPRLGCRGSDPVGNDNAKLLNRVEHALGNCGYNEFHGVTVRSMHGTIRLEGRVRSWHMKLIAQEAARQVPGVVHLTNAIEVAS